MPYTRLSLREVEPEDLPALQRIRAAAFAPVFDSFRSLVGRAIGAVAFARADAEQAQLLDNLCRDGSGHTVLVLTRDGAALGFVAYSVDSETGIGEIGLNAIDPDQAGRGLGTWMYRAVLERMKTLGARVATVGTGADASHAAARRAYEKVGFRLSVPSVQMYRLL